MALTLYHNDMSVCAQKVRLCLAEKDLAYEAKHLNLREGEQKRPEYLALNPNGYVPTLVHDGFVVCELTVICEYLDDAFPDPPLKPADAKGRARMRGFTKFIDAAIFPATGTVSMSIAFHHQYKPEMYDTMEKARPGWLANLRQLQKGTENPAFPAAIKRLDKMIADMDRALAERPVAGGRDLLARRHRLRALRHAARSSQIPRRNDRAATERCRVVRSHARAQALPERAGRMVQSQISAADGREGERGVASRQGASRCLNFQRSANPSPLLRRLARFEVAVLRPRQAEIFAQRLAFVLAAEDAAALQFGHH